MSTPRTSRESREYNRQLWLQEKRVNRDSGLLEWVDVRLLHCAVKPKISKLAIDGVQETEQIKVNIFTPWKLGMFARAVERRLVDKEHTYWIEGAFDVNDAKREYQMICTERPHGS